jgi:4-hydroxy-3-polyprenylbenzoate decarboxylase
MSYRTLRDCVEDLRREQRLIECSDLIDARLEIAEIQRRVFARQGPAVLFTNVKDCRFPMLGNLFGSLERARFIFRDTWETVRRAIEIRLDPTQFFRRPTRYARSLLAANRMRPTFKRRAAVLKYTTRISELPQQISWPRDGGAFVTLPLVYTELATQPGWRRSNLGMYRIQLSGGQYASDSEVGMHYQIHRGIGVHHQAAIAAGKPLRVNIFVGGTPAMTLAAVMPLPENMSELGFAGALAGFRIPLAPLSGSHVYADADFCICGTIDPNRLLPEGPFGDHLGYYSLQHEFPVLKVERVYHRAQAIWPFTVVGRPPQEDTVFGQLIHELTGPVLPSLLPGIRAVHAVDASGVHPLLLAIGSERYVPYRPTTRPQEILTQAHALLGQGQLSLAKYLVIVDHAAKPDLDIHRIAEFLQCFLERVDWSRDLHFQTQTTIDTLDYSGTKLNEGSKVVMAAAGSPIRNLSHNPDGLRLPPGFVAAGRAPLAGTLIVSGPAFPGGPSDPGLGSQFDSVAAAGDWSSFPLIVVVDDAERASTNLRELLWVTFTRSNPATDIHGMGAFVEHKHWGCRGSLIVDARTKPHHAPPLEVDPETSRRVDALAARGGPLSPYL